MTEPVYMLNEAGERVELTGEALASFRAFQAAAAEGPTLTVPDRCTKLGLKRALAETGPGAVFPEPEWPAVRALLAAYPDIQEDWDLATEIRRIDPLTQAVIAARQYSDETVDALLVRATAIVA